MNLRIKSLFIAWSCLPLLAGPSFGQDPAAPPAKEVFANAHLLKTCAWLDAQRADRGLVVLDARSPDEYAQGHIPGAINLPTSDTFDPKHRGDLGSPEQIARHLGARGVTPATGLVIYDGGKSTSAARVFWTLELYGHAKVAVLDGGFTKWKADKREVSREAAKPTAAKYKFGQAADRLSTKAGIIADMKDSKCVMLDARSQGEFDAGRIPGAVHIDWVKNFTGDEVPTLLSPAKLRALYVDQGVTRDKRVHAY
jgi:thiosulfate/3-mercaptopyruvate sulfurtransferase